MEKTAETERKKAVIEAEKVAQVADIKFKVYWFFSKIFFHSKI